MVITGNNIAEVITITATGGKKKPATSKKIFIATGGGTYTTKNGVYTENIEFFSRDSTRVGMKLKFEYSLKDVNWNHKGFSSRGKSINEIWTKR